MKHYRAMIAVPILADDDDAAREQAKTYRAVTVRGQVAAIYEAESGTIVELGIERQIRCPECRTRIALPEESRS
jgi:hypothetical protein